jgi:NTE family protein
MTTDRALVLGGGGVAGIAWQTGVLLGLAESGVDVLDVGLVVGTSAGSTVAAQATSGLSLGELFERQVDPALQTPEIAAKLDITEFATAMTDAMVGARDADDARSRIGAMALAANTVNEAQRRAVIAARLPVDTWPSRRLAVVAVDAHSGESRVFDQESDVDLVDAVTASCAVPGVWPPVTIAGRRYVDGGVRSMENADLAVGFDRVLVLSLLPPDAPSGPWPGLDQQVRALEEQGAKVAVVRPDDASVTAIGVNPLDPATREPAARAGREQGRAEAARVAQVWS